MLVFVFSFVLINLYDLIVIEQENRQTRTKLEKLNVQKRLIFENYQKLQSGIAKVSQLESMNEKIDQHFIDLLKDNIEQISKELEIHKKNLYVLSERKAKQGLEFSIKLHHQIEYEKNQAQKLLNKLSKERHFLAKLRHE